MHQLRHALRDTTDLADSAPVVITTPDGRHLTIETVDATSNKVEGFSRGHTYRGTPYLRIHARPATSAEIAAAYAPAEGEDPTGAGDGYI